MANKTNLQDMAAASAIGAVGALLFLFMFPGSAISTLMHEVFKLPGPGVGFGVVFGPFMAVCALAASRLTGKRWAAAVSSAAFGAVMSVIVSVFKLQTADPGRLGSIEFFIGAVLLGLSLEAALYFFSKVREPVRFAASAVFADMVFLAYSMFFIFAKSVPEKYAALTGSKVLIIFAVSALSAVVFSVLSLLVLKIIKR